MSIIQCFDFVRIAGPIWWEIKNRLTYKSIGRMAVIPSNSPRKSHGPPMTGGTWWPQSMQCQKAGLSWAAVHSLKEGDLNSTNSMMICIKEGILKSIFHACFFWKLVKRHSKKKKKLELKRKEKPGIEKQEGKQEEWRRKFSKTVLLKKTMEEKRDKERDECLI